MDQGFSSEFHSQLLDHTKRSGVGWVGAGVDIHQLEILETVSQNRSGGLRRDSLPPMRRRDAVKNFDFARDAAVFSKMAQSGEADQLGIIFETDRPETEAVTHEAVNAAFNDGDGGLSRNDPIVPQKLPYARINPQTMQRINVVRRERAHQQPRRR